MNKAALSILAFAAAFPRLAATASFADDQRRSTRISSCRTRPCPPRTNGRWAAPSSIGTSTALEYVQQRNHRVQRDHQRRDARRKRLRRLRQLTLQYSHRAGTFRRRAHVRGQRRHHRRPTGSRRRTKVTLRYLSKVNKHFSRARACRLQRHDLEVTDVVRGNFHRSAAEGRTLRDKTTSNSALRRLSARSSRSTESRYPGRRPLAVHERHVRADPPAHLERDRQRSRHRRDRHPVRQHRLGPQRAGRLQRPIPERGHKHLKLRARRPFSAASATAINSESPFRRPHIRQKGDL